MSDHVDRSAPQPAAELIHLQLALYISFPLDTLLQQRKYLMTDTGMKYEQKKTFKSFLRFFKTFHFLD